jgi:hypothetical protein
MDSKIYPFGEAYLPLGSHLLPYEFQTFLIEWNMAISAYSPEVDEEAWKGESRREYQKKHPELWEAYMAEFKRLNTLYAAEVKALKQYQKEYKKMEELEAAVAAAQEARNKARAIEEEIAFKNSLAYACTKAAMGDAAAAASAQAKNELSIEGIE